MVSQSGPTLECWANGNNCYGILSVRDPFIYAVLLYVHSWLITICELKGKKERMEESTTGKIDSNGLDQ